LSPYELLAVLFDQPFWRCSLPEPATVIKKLKEQMASYEPGMEPAGNEADSEAQSRHQSETWAQFHART
jgi:hypothetical protein